MAFVVNPGKLFQGVQQQGGGGPEKVGGLSGDDSSVMQLQGSGRAAAFFCHGKGGIYHFSVMDRDVCLVHEHLDFIYFFIRAGAEKPPSQ